MSGNPRHCSATARPHGLPSGAVAQLPTRSGPATIGQPHAHGCDDPHPYPHAPMDAGCVAWVNPVAGLPGSQIRGKAGNAHE